MSDPIGRFVTGAIILLFIFIYGAILGRDEGLKAIRTEAVQRGFATWVSDEYGNTTFTWKEPAP